MSVDKNSIFGDLAKKLAEIIANVIKDLGTLEIITTTGKVIKIQKKSTGADVFDIEETGIAAKTIIEIDGDIIVKLPVKDTEGGLVEIDEKILQIHDENVAMAMENWRTFITTLLNIAKDLKDYMPSAVTTDSDTPKRRRTE